MFSLPPWFRCRSAWFSPGVLCWVMLCAVRVNAQVPPAPDASLPQAQPQPAETLAQAPIEVTVVGTSVAKTAGSAHVINSKQLERWEYDDPLTVLSSVPGVYVRSEDGMGLRPNIGLRGVNPDRSKKVTLLEDGLLFGPAPYSAPAAYYFPIVTRMTQVKVIKGPAAIGYGPQTVGGAIDFITRPIPSTTSGGADVALGQYGYGKAHAYAGTSDERVGFLIEGVRLQNNGFKELPSGADTGFIRNEWMVKGSYLVDPNASVRNELRVKLTYSDEVSNESYLGLSDADFKRNPNRRYAASELDRMRNHRTSIVLSHVLEPSSRLSLTTSAYRNAFSRAWRKVNDFRGASIFEVLRNPNAPSNATYHAILNGEADSSSPTETLLIGPNERDFLAAGVESRLRWDGATGVLSHRLEAGARYHYDTIDRRHSESGFLVTGDQLYPDGGPTVVTAFNKGESHTAALHAVDAVTWSSLTLTPGVRAELMRFGYEDRLNDERRRKVRVAILPGAGLYYAFTEQLGVLAGVYRGFSPPPPESAKQAEPERSINYEGGARYAKGPLRVESIAFFNDYQNLTDICTLSSGCSQADLDQQFNAGRARIYGLEAFAQHDIPVGPVKLPVLVSYTYTKSKFLRSFKSNDPIFGEVAKNDEMPYVPRHQARASLGVEHVRGGGSLGATYVGRMREEAGKGSISSGLHTDTQIVLDATGQVRLVGPFVLYANVQNLLDSQYIVSRRPYGARPNAPRWLHVGLKATF